MAKFCQSIIHIYSRFNSQGLNYISRNEHAMGCLGGDTGLYRSYKIYRTYKTYRTDPWAALAGIQAIALFGNLAIQYHNSVSQS